MTKHTTVSIPKPLYDRIKKRIEGTGFTSASDYVTYVLREILADLETETKTEDDDRIKRKLRALGYLG
jgi:Arc/MetJ-type ribon-helix-helix transcriptional regulator